MGAIDNVNNVIGNSFDIFSSKPQTSSAAGKTESFRDIYRKLEATYLKETSKLVGTKLPVETKLPGTNEIVYSTNVQNLASLHIGLSDKINKTSVV